MAISSFVFFFLPEYFYYFFFARYMAISSLTILHSLTLFLTVYCHYYYYFVTRIQSLLHLKSAHTGVILSPWTFQSSGRKRTKKRRKKILGGHYVKTKSINFLYYQEFSKFSPLGPRNLLQVSYPVWITFSHFLY